MNRRSFLKLAMGAVGLAVAPFIPTAKAEPTVDAKPTPNEPPGSVCMICGEDDVDINNGEFRCNSCGCEGRFVGRVSHEDIIDYEVLERLHYEKFWAGV